MTKYRAVCFDVGETLIHYKGVPLSWQLLYKEALKQTAKACSYSLTSRSAGEAEAILKKYNTHINPRRKEVSADQIMGEILDAWNVPKPIHLHRVKQAFFSFFQQKMITYEDTMPALQFLKAKNLKIGVFTDVPYGMDKEYVEQDLKDIRAYIDCIVTSRDAGYRKPDPQGFTYLAEQIEVKPEETMFVGNEEKDIMGARAAKMFSVLIDRENTKKMYGEDLNISSLQELESVVK